MTDDFKPVPLTPEAKSRFGRKPRHGLSLKCKCGYEHRIGGYKSASQVQKIQDEVMKSHGCKKPEWDIGRSYHAAEIEHAIARQATQQVLTGTTCMTDICGSTLTSGNFTACDDYLLIANLVYATNFGVDSSTRVVHGCTPTVFSDSIHTVESQAACEWHTYKWFTIWNAVSGECVRIQHQIFSSIRQRKSNAITLVAIHVEELTLNTDYFYDEDTTNACLTTCWTTDGGTASIIFTPAATQDYLVMGWTRMDSQTTNTNTEARLETDAGTTTTPVWSQEGECGSSDVFMYTMSRVFSFDNTEHTVRMQSRIDGGCCGRRLANGLFILRLDVFDAVAHSYTDGTQSMAVCPDYGQTVATVCLDTGGTQDVWYMGQSRVDNIGTSHNALFRMRVGSTDSPTGQTSVRNTFMEAWDNTDDTFFNLQDLTSQTTGCKTYHVDGSGCPASETASQRLMIAISMELAASGTCIVKVSPTENVNINESDNRLGEWVRNLPTENVNINEDSNRLGAMVRVAPLCTVDIDEDSNRVGGIIKNPPIETVDIDEASNRLGAQVRIPPVENVNINESDNRLGTWIRNLPTENVNINEVSNRLGSLVRNAVTFTVGLSEAAAQSILGKVRNILTTIKVSDSRYITFSSLQSHIKFDDTVVCTAGNCSNGTWTGTETYTIGYIDKAGDFDGCSYVTLANECAFDREHCQPFSITYWLKIASFCSGTIVTFGKRNSFAPCAGYMMGVRACPNNDIFMEMSNGTTDYAVFGGAVADDTWHHVAFTFEGNSDQDGMRIYRDGKLFNTGASVAITCSMLNNIAPVLGAEGDGQNNLTGQMDDVQFYTKQLSADEIRIMAQGGNSRLVGIIRELPETVELNEARNRLGNLIRAIPENVNLNEVLNKVGTWVRNITTTVKVSDTKYTTFSNLDAHIKFDDDVLCAAGNSHNGTWTASEDYAIGYIDKSGVFINTNRVKLSDECAFDYEWCTPFSLAAWVKATCNNDNIITKGFSGGDSARFAIQTGTAGKVAFSMQNSSSPRNSVSLTGNACSQLLTDDNWHHVAAVNRGTGFVSGVDLYVDGVLLTCNQTLHCNLCCQSILNNVQIAIGGWGCCSSNAFSGNIDDAQIYSKALTAEEVRQMARGGNQRLLGMVRNLPTFNVNINEARNRLGGLIRNLPTFNVNINEAINKVGTWIRNIPESVNINEVSERILVGAGALLKLINETLNINEITPQRIGTWIRNIPTDNVNINEVSERIGQLIRNLATTVKVSDTKYTTFSSLEAHIKLDDTVVCTAGNCNNGTWCGTESYVIGYIDKSGDFDGCSFITLANECNFDFTTASPFSVAFWFNTTVTCVGSNSLVSKRASPYEEGWSVELQICGVVRLAIEDICNTVMRVDSTAVINDGLWHSIIVTYDGTNNSTGMKAHIDGIDVSTNRANSCLTTITNNITVQIGAHDGCSILDGGQIDDVQIYSKELSAGEIRQIVQGANIRLGGLIRNLPTFNVNINEVSQRVGTWVRNLLSTVKVSDTKYTTFSNLEAHIKFDDTVVCTVGNCNNGTWTGCEAYVIGQIDKSGCFDGSSRVALANECNFDFTRTSSFSVAGWMKFDSGTGVDILWFKRNGRAIANIGWGLRRTSGNNLVWEFSDGLEEISVAEAGCGNTVQDVWYHIVTTYDGSGDGNGMKIYKDGALNNTGGSDPFSCEILNNCLVTLGAESDGGDPLNGQLDDIQIYSKELSADEVRQIHKGGISRLVGIKRTLPTENVNISEAINRLGTWIRNIPTENVNINEAINRVLTGAGALIKLINDTLNINETPQKIGTWIRNLTSTVKVSDTKYTTFGNLEAHIKFDDDITCSAGNCHNGTMKSGCEAYVIGYIDKSFCFDNTRRIELSDACAFDFDFACTFSVAFWVKHTDTTGLTLPIIGNRIGTGLTHTGWNIFFNSAGRFIVEFSNGIIDPQKFTGAFFDDDIWHHVVFTYNGNSSQTGINIYVDGVLNNNLPTATFTGSMVSADKVIIGGNTAGDGQNIQDGNVDDVQIYTDVLTPDEVRQMVRGGNQRLLGLLRNVPTANINISEAVNRLGTLVRNLLSTVKVSDTKYTTFSGLEAHIKFDDTVVCTAGNCNNGTWCGTETYDIGYIDKAGCFNGASFVSLANECNFDFDISCTLSVAFWLKTTETGSKGVVTKRTATNATGWEAVIRNCGDIRFIHEDTAAKTMSITSTTKVNDDKWHHIVVTYDGSNASSGYTMYIDGSNNCGTLFNQNLVSILNNTLVNIGAQDGARFLNGQVDDVQIYNVVLTSDEVRIMAQGSNNRILGIVRNAITSNVNINEAVNKAGTWIRNLPETINISESRNKIGTWVRNIPETINISEVKNRLRALVRILPETINITESKRRIVGIIRELPSTINLNEVINSLTTIAAATASIGRTVKRVLGLSNTTTSMDTASETSSQASIETSKTIKSEGN